ncbi:hypothetical protein GCK32_002243 [Trichostrongylus colubriformis]|uniref:Uncharacterized protein n=1 Tax=Trichostrongylus colubriformis TaxID=6319 RepID=A0AAN8FIA2_TRICO
MADGVLYSSVPGSRTDAQHVHVITISFLSAIRSFDSCCPLLTFASLHAMNGFIKNKYLQSQDGIYQSDPPTYYYYNPVALHLEYKNFIGDCECQINLWSAQFHATVSITFIVTLVGTLAILYFWAGAIFGRTRSDG